MIKTCIIGVSGFGDTHYRDLLREAEAGRMEPVAAAIINQDEEAAKCEKLRSLGAEIFDDYEAMLSAWGDRADLCMIPTGIHWHAPMTVAALEAGMNVFVEKPVAPTIQALQSMRSAEKRTGRFVAVGFQHTYNEATHVMKRRIVAGEFGRIQSGGVRVWWPRSDSYYNRNRWAGQMRHEGQWVLDSPYNNANAHYINLLCFLAGPDERTTVSIESVEAELYHANPIESADTASIRATTTDGVTLCYHGSHACEVGFGPELRLVAEKATVNWGPEDDTFHILWNDGRTEALPMGTDLRTPIMDRVIPRIADPSVWVCSLDIAAAHTLVVNGAHESSDINTIPGEYVKAITSDHGSVQQDILDLGTHIDSAFESGQLFSELGVPWAVAGRKVSVVGYEKFDGGAWSGA
jgi:predicted dehydrogenase